MSITSRDQLHDGLDYVGMHGVTQDCIEAILRTLQYRDVIRSAKLITYQADHAFILETEECYNTIIVRAGFSSGYDGGGPSGLAYILSVFKEFDIDTVEYDVSEKLFNRLNEGLLTFEDVDSFEKLRPTRPVRIYDYMYAYHQKGSTLSEEFPLPMPFRLIDPRLQKLAIDFWTAPGDRIFNGFRLLEETVRTRCEIEEHGAKVFSRAFIGAKSILEWEGLHTGEQTGRGNLFVGAYSAFRNPRAHREFEATEEELLSEFLTLNQLFRLESKATTRVLEEELETEVTT